MQRDREQRFQIALGTPADPLTDVLRDGAQARQRDLVTMKDRSCPPRPAAMADYIIY
jgi:hypothetical protein